MSKRRLLEATKQDFTSYYNRQPNKVKWELATTPMNAKTQLARLRRLYLKTNNDINYKVLKELTGGK